MPRRKKPNDYGTGIPYHEVEALARGLCGRRCGDPPPRPDSNPDLKEPSVARKRGRQREYAEWKAKQQAEQENKS